MIGIDDYKHFSKLKNAVNDATAMRDALKSKGVDVVFAKDCDITQLKGRMNVFLKRLNKGDIAIVFFAGHGVEYNCANRLLAICGEGRKKPNFRLDSLNVRHLLDK